MALAEPHRLPASRLLLCLATAAIIWVASYFCAWNGYRNVSHHQWPQFSTWQGLERLRQEIERHREATGRPPATLAELTAVKQEVIRTDKAGHPVDAWGQVIQYRVEGSDYVLWSYGADGRPGGDGPDADIYAGEPDPWTEVPTFWDFVTRPATLPVHLACILAGALAFPICLLYARGEPGQRPSLARVLLANAVTALFAVFAALVIGSLHFISSGH